MSRADHLASLFDAIEAQATEALDTLDGWGVPDTGAALSLRGIARGVATLAATAAATCTDEGDRFPEEQHSRIGGFVVTYAGHRFWPLDPRPDEVDLIDIAHALSLKNRFGCMTKRAYSVAEHSLLVASLCRRIAEREGVDADLAFAHGLLHDAEEAYLPDIPRPIKGSIPGWGRIAARVQDAILEAVGIGPMTAEVSTIVQRADDLALVTEARCLFDFDPVLWAGGLPTTPEDEHIDGHLDFDADPPPTEYWRDLLYTRMAGVAVACATVDVVPAATEGASAWLNESRGADRDSRCKVCNGVIDAQGQFGLCGACMGGQ